MHSGVASVEDCRRAGRGSPAALRKKIPKASDPDRSHTAPFKFQRMRRKTGEQNIVQLCPSLRPSEGQILRGRPEAARGGQVLRGDSHLASGQACLVGPQPGFLAHVQA